MIKINGNTYIPYLGNAIMNKVVHVDSEGNQSTIWEGTQANLYMGFLLRSKINSGLTAEDIVGNEYVLVKTLTGASEESIVCTLPASVPAGSWEEEDPEWVANNAYALTLIQPLTGTTELHDILTGKITLTDGGIVTISGVNYKIGYNVGQDVAYYGSDEGITNLEYLLKR